MLIVLGSGVSGLTSAITLKERSPERPVEIWTRSTTVTETTSSVAAAFWYPFRIAPSARVVAWAKSAYARFSDLAKDPETGVTQHQAFDYWRRDADPPWFAEALPDLRPAAPNECPPGFSSGWVFTSMVIDTRRYMPWLAQRAVELGISIVHRTVTDLAVPLERASVVINCTGLGSRALVNDPLLVPTRGQLVHVRNPGLDRVLLDEHDPDIAYAVPRGDHVVLGGTATPFDEDTDPRPTDTAAIRQRCAALLPTLGEADVIGERVGIRPNRAEIRLDTESRPGGHRVIHNYGHGGAGITLSWGCATNVANLVDESMSPTANESSRPLV